MKSVAIPLYQTTRRPIMERRIAIFIGMGLGAFVSFVMSLEMKWGVGLSFAALLFFIALITRDIKRFALAAFVFFLPINADFHLIKYEHIGGGAAGLRISICDILIALLYFSWVAQLALRINYKAHMVDFCRQNMLPALAFFGAACVSIINAAMPLYSLFELFRMLIGIAIFFYMANHLRDRKTITGVLIILFIGLIIQSLIAFLQKWTNASLNLIVLGERPEILLEELGKSSITSRVGGTIGHPNGFAHYLEYLLPLGLSLILSSAVRKRHRIFYGIAFSMGLVALILTLSRGAWVGCAIAIFCVILFTLRRKKIKNILPIILIIIITVLIAGLFLGKTIISRFIEEDYGSALSRFTLMEVAFEIIKAHPLLGIGLNNYVDVMQDYDTTSERVTYYYGAPVHNIYLIITSEIGMLGLGAFIWLLISFFKRSIQGIKSTDAFQSSLTLGLTASLGAYLIHGMVNMVYLGSEIMPWFYGGFLIAVSKLSPLTHSSTNNNE